MSIDLLLTTALRAYQEQTSRAQRDKVLGTTATLLTNLTNPLNISLLTSHLLTARAIWEDEHNGDILPACQAILGVYNTAASHIRQRQNDSETGPGRCLDVGEWARAVLKGADERSPRWKHTLVLTAVLLGLDGQQQQQQQQQQQPQPGGESENKNVLSWWLRSTIKGAIVTATNMALAECVQSPQSPHYQSGVDAIVVSLSYAFPVLSEADQHGLNADLLLTAVLRSVLGLSGFNGANFLLNISANSSTGVSRESLAPVQGLVSKLLVQNLGPLSRVAAFAVQHAVDSAAVLEAHDALFNFTVQLRDKWRQSRFSVIDMAAEVSLLSPDVLQGPWTTLWELLRKIMYTVVATLQPMVARSLLDPRLRNNKIAPVMAAKTLHALRNMYFISSRQGADAFQAYTFTYLTSLDILTRFPEACISFLVETGPSLSPSSSPLEEALSLYYLNTAEHLPLTMPTPMVESLILYPATHYLSHPPSLENPTSLALPIFEAAHAAMLSALSCPQHASQAMARIPFYTDALLNAFPAYISPRQFRLAFRTVIQISSPPFPLAASHPLLAETLLELVHVRATTASTAVLPADPVAPAQPRQGTTEPDQDLETPAPLSEQSTLVHALIDALPFVPPHNLTEWLGHTARAVCTVGGVPALRDASRRRFWDMLAGGELDVERAAVGVAWWGTLGGREMLMGLGGGKEEAVMSGALVGRGDGSRL